MLEHLDEPSRESRARRVAKANSLAGTAAHVPSLMIVWRILSQAVAATPLHRGFACAPAEAALRARIRHTALELGVAEACPAVLAPDAIVDDMLRVLAGVHVEQDVWCQVRIRLRRVPVWELQHFTVNQFMMGAAVSECGPEWRAQRRRAKGMGARGMQRSAGNGRRGLDYAIKPGLSPEAHVRTACSLPDPFAVETESDSDLKYAAKLTVILGRAVSAYRSRQTDVLNEVIEALEPLTRNIRRSLTAEVAKVAGATSPALLACLTVIMQ